MKIAILGAGFGGLSAAFHLCQKGHEVSVFEKFDKVGGLAVGFQKKNWSWPLEKHYHHFFTNDKELIDLCKNFGIPLIFPKSLTSLYYQGKIYPFNSPFDILSFTPLSFFDRLRLGSVSLFLKLLPQSFGQKLESFTAISFAQKLFGQKVFKIVWEPLLNSKFGKYVKDLNAAWLWARIKKRTLKLGYVKGGFQTIAEALAKKIEEKGGKILLNTEIENVQRRKNEFYIQLAGKPTDFSRSRIPSDSRGILTPQKNFVGFPQQALEKFDAVISTLPTSIFMKIVSNLPKNYVQNLSSIPHLHALNLVIELKESFLKDTYWLNINDANFPFLCVVQHTNFIDKKYYGGNHILYVSNYLPKDHPYFKKTAEELLMVYEPYLKKINPLFSIKYQVLSIKQFVGPFAQPVFLKNYSHIRPFGKTPIPNLYFANLDSVYPWDRGTNYALELGRKIAELIPNYEF